MAVAVLGLALLALGRWLGLPWRLRLGGLAALWLAAILAHLALPEGHALRAAIGGRFRFL
ncbi:MAG: molybdopterin biosynthesis protein, partial [Rhodobacteraceae bacterium]|nr:molybdopterin biosynthesis protein [Paracoccaceae bacterium]